MGFILKLNRTLPEFTFEILSFDEETNNIEFVFNGGQSTYNVVFTDQSDNILGNLDGYSYTSDGIKNETLNAEFGVVTIIGTITDGNTNELSDTISVAFTTTTTEYEPIATQIAESNLKFGGFISNQDIEYGQNSPVYNESSLDQVVTMDNLIIDTTITKLNLLDYEDNFKYEVDVDFSVNIQYDGMLAAGESVNILVPRIRLVLPLNTFRKTASTFQPQFAVTSWRMYNIDSIAYELNTISIDNNGTTFSANGKIEVNIENTNIPYIDNNIDAINADDVVFNSPLSGEVIVRFNRTINTANDVSVLSSTIHSDSNIVSNNINFTIGQTSKVFTYIPSNGLENQYYVGNLIRLSDYAEPKYLLDSGNIGFAEKQFEQELEVNILNISDTEDGYRKIMDMVIFGGEPNYSVRIFYRSAYGTPPGEEALVGLISPYTTNGRKDPEFGMDISTDLNRIEDYTVEITDGNNDVATDTSGQIISEPSTTFEPYELIIDDFRLSTNEVYFRFTAGNTTISPYSVDFYANTIGNFNLIASETYTTEGDYVLTILPQVGLTEIIGRITDDFGTVRTDTYPISTIT